MKATNNFFSTIAVAIIVMVLVFSMTSCKKEAPACPRGYQSIQVYSNYCGCYVWDCVPVGGGNGGNGCNTCGNDTNTVPNPNPGVTTPITSGYLYAPGQANVIAFKQDVNGNLIVATTQNGNPISSPTIWGVQLFDSFEHAVGWALLHNGTAATGANQKLKDYFTRYPGVPLYVTVEMNVNGYPFGELQTGTKMFFQITSIPALGV